MNSFGEQEIIFIVFILCVGMFIYGLVLLSTIKFRNHDKDVQEKKK